MYISATAYRGSNSESFGVNSGSKSKKVCLPAEAGPLGMLNLTPTWTRPGSTSTAGDFLR